MAAMPSAPRPIYLDHNATTPVDPRVVERMLPYFAEKFGNASSVEHAHGNEAAAAVRDAREEVAGAIGARENEILFTGSCTEANNIAILGAVRANPERRHIVTSRIEHPSVIEPCRRLEQEGYPVTWLDVDEYGRVSPEAVAGAVRDATCLVSVMGANNEVGTIQPLAEIGSICEQRGALFHADLAQLLAHHRVDVVADHIHLASISGHKAYGPKGVGALYVRSRGPRARLQPILFGGGQEKGLRSGTLNVPAIVGLAEAMRIARREGDEDARRLRAMRDRFEGRIAEAVDGVSFNGHPSERLPGLSSISIAGVEPLALMHRLSAIASFSASSACATDKVETSHVLLAMFGDTARARQAFRVSPGRSTAAADLELFANALVDSVGELRRFAA